MSNNPPVKKNKFLMWCSDIQQKHWGYYLLLVRLSALWFSLFIAFLGEPMHLVTVTDSGSKILTWFGWICTIVIFSVIAVGEYAKKYAEKAYSEPFEIGGFALLNNLRSGINTICDSKYRTLLSQIHAIKETQTFETPLIVSDPPKQLDSIAKEMANCLCQLLKDNSRWKADDLYVSIAYQFPLEGQEWHWATEEHGMSLEELLAPATDKGISTLNHLLSSKGSSVFFNSKAEAEQRKIYLADDSDERDEQGNLMGSIACYEHHVKKHDVTYIRFVLMVTTYSKRFVPDDSPEIIDNVKYNMKSFVVSDFIVRTRIELCLLYLDQLHKHQVEQKVAAANLVADNPQETIA